MLAELMVIGFTVITLGLVISLLHLLYTSRRDHKKKKEKERKRKCQ